MQCIDLLMKHGIPFNRLVLSANPGFFCKKVAYDNFMNDEEKLKFGEKVKRNL